MSRIINFNDVSKTRKKMEEKAIRRRQAGDEMIYAIAARWTVETGNVHEDLITGFDTFQSWTGFRREESLGFDQT